MHRSTKHIHKTKVRVTQTTLIAEGELRCPRKVGSSCFTMNWRIKNIAIISVYVHIPRYVLSI